MAPATFKYKKDLKNTLNHYELLQKILDARATRKASLQFRKNTLERQTKNNYQMEHDRIRNQLEAKAIPGQHVEMLRERMKRLHELGARHIDFIN